MSVAFRRMMSRFSYRMRRIHITRYLFLAVLILFAVFFMQIYNKTFLPILRQITESRANFYGNIAINEGVGLVLATQKIDYEDLVTFAKDNSGNITGLMTNLTAVNRLKSELTILINEKLDNIKNMEILIPLGNISGMEMFSGLGPNIKIRLVPTTATKVDFKSAFEEAGINQTKHTIFLEVSSDITILMPNNMSSSSQVTSRIQVAETVIVGRVPDTLAKVGLGGDALRSDILDINNYSSSPKISD